jgi:hypothetical protein
VQWSPPSEYSLYAHAAYQHLSALQLGSESFAAADWRTSHDDRFIAFGGGARAKINERLELDLNVTRTDGEGQQRIATTNLTSQLLPAVTSRLTSAHLRARYDWSDSLTASLQVRYERARNADWALDGVAPDTVPSLLALGMQPHNYSAAAIGLSLQYRYP